MPSYSVQLYYLTGATGAGAPGATDGEYPTWQSVVWSVLLAVALAGAR